MIKSNHLVAAAIICLFLSPIVTDDAVRGQATKPRPIVKIDARTTRDASQMQLPSSAKWDKLTDDLGLHDIHVEIDLPEGKSYQFDVEGLLISRDKNGLIQSILFVLYDDTPENLHAMATKLAKDWNVPTTKFDDWLLQVKSGKWNGDKIDDMRNSPKPAAHIEIRESFGDSTKTPGYLTFEISWDELPATATATAPATAPMPAPSTRQTPK